MQVIFPCILVLFLFFLVIIYLAPQSSQILVISWNFVRGGYMEVKMLPLSSWTKRCQEIEKRTLKFITLPWKKGSLISHSYFKYCLSILKTCINYNIKKVWLDINKYRDGTLIQKLKIYGTRQGIGEFNASFSAKNDLKIFISSMSMDKKKFTPYLPQA
jgi:hypothetical protein